jgi:hypothetical protein
MLFCYTSIVLVFFLWFLTTSHNKDTGIPLHSTQLLELEERLSLLYQDLTKLCSKIQLKAPDEIRGSWQSKLRQLLWKALYLSQVLAEVLWDWKIHLSVMIVMIGQIVFRGNFSEAAELWNVEQQDVQLLPVSAGVVVDNWALSDAGK